MLRNTDQEVGYVAHVYECGEILRTFKEKIRKGSVCKALCNPTRMVRLCKGKELPPYCVQRSKRRLD
jgi:hypothetical protein